MPALKSRRHEAVAQGLAKGWTQSKAYIKAGYTGKEPGKLASMLLKNSPEILDRLDEIRNREADKEKRVVEQALKAEQVTKQYVIRAAVETLELALGRKKVKRTRSNIRTKKVALEYTAMEQEQINRGETVERKFEERLVADTVDFDAFMVDLPTAKNMVELLGRDHSLFVETKRLQTGPLDSVPQDQVDDALAIINAAIAAGEAKALAEESGSADAEPRPQDA